MPEVISRKEARQKGLKRYFTGLTCKNGHLSERNVITKVCLACDVMRNMPNQKKTNFARLEQARAAHKRWWKQGGEGVKRAKARNSFSHTKRKVQTLLASAARVRTGKILDLKEAIDIFKAQDNAFDYDMEALSEQLKDRA